jgi:membrane protease subunit HflC
MGKILMTVVLLVAVLLAASSALFTVDRAEFVYVTQFGQHVATFDGADANDAGLHVKWPWPIQTVTRLDRRLQTFDLPAAELLTHDPRGNTIDKTLTIDGYVCWHIADKGAVDRFIRSVGTPDGACILLRQQISSELGAAIGQMELDDLISTEPGKVDRQRERLRQRLLNETEADAGKPRDGMKDRARREYGIELVDIRLRRTNHPAGVREAIFDRIRSERNKKVAEYQSEGTRLAEDIKSATERKVRGTLADARAQEQKLKGEADAEADRIRDEAHRKDPQFYAFLKKLEQYRQILGDNKSVLLLSSHRELFDVLFAPPKLENGSKPILRDAKMPAPPVKTGGQ